MDGRLRGKSSEPHEQADSLGVCPSHIPHHRRTPVEHPRAGIHVTFLAQLCYADARTRHPVLCSVVRPPDNRNGRLVLPLLRPLCVV